MKGLFSGPFWKNSQGQVLWLYIIHLFWPSCLLRHLTSVLYQDSFCISTSFTVGHHWGQSSRSPLHSILGLDPWVPARTLTISFFLLITPIQLYSPHHTHTHTLHCKIFMIPPHIQLTHSSWCSISQFLCYVNIFSQRRNCTLHIRLCCGLPLPHPSPSHLFFFF